MASVVVLLLTGCSEDGGDDGAAPAVSLSGEPVKLGMAVPISGAGLQIPDAGRAAEAAEKAINARGGINGRPLDVIVCDDRDDPQQAQQCADKLINSDQVIAVTGVWGRQHAALYPVIGAKNVPMFANSPVIPDDFSNPLSHPFIPGRLAWKNAGLAATGKSWKRVAVVNYTTGRPNYDFAVQGFKTVGVDDVVLIEVEPATTNWAPVAARLKQANVDAYTMPIAEGQITLLLQAAADAGVEGTAIVQSGTLSPRVLDAADKADVDLRALLTFVLDPAKSERRKQMLDELKQYAPDLKDNLSDATVLAWLGPTMFAEAVKDGAITDLTPAGVTKWLQSGPLKTGMSADIDFTKPGQSASEPRVANLQMVPAELKDGKLVLLKDDFSTLAGT
jgi:ABC-type branched-subunit amino acid transport system substrate-binding protein